MMKKVLVILGTFAAFFALTDSAVVTGGERGSVLEFEAGKVKDDACECDSISCSCCQAVSAEGVIKSVCLVVFYKESAKEFELVLTVEDITVYTANVSVSNPEQQCTNIVVQLTNVKTCVNFRSIKVESTGLTGCMNLVITVSGDYFTFDFGCFNLKPQKTKILDVQIFLLSIIQRKKP